MAGVRILLSCIFLIALVTSCNRQERKPVDPEEVLIRYTRFLSNEAIARHDTTALSAFWSPDYHVVTSRNFEVSGKKANLERLQNEFNAKEDVVYVRSSEAVSVFMRWNMASESGTWVGRWTDNGEACELSGTYFAKWHKISGQWYIRAELFVPLNCTGKFCDQSPIP